MNHPRFELYKDKRGEFRFRLTAKNGQNILASEGYNSKSAAKNGIASVQKNAGNADRYEKKTSESGKFSFSLKAGNNQVIGTSQSYASASARDNGIKSVMTNAANADTMDESNA
jgi:hypothetical protein